jgi:hypothetical protein
VDEVDMRFVESGDHAMPERVDHARTRPDQSSDVTLIAHGGDAASGHGERGGLRPGGIPGRDPAVAEDEISRSRHARARVAAAAAMAVLGVEGGTSVFNPKFPPSRLADAFDQVVEPLITEIT